jgi:hypothetical protein
MSNARNTLADCEQPMIRFICDKCGRKGQYRKARLVGKYGPDVAMPDLLHKVADCPHWQPMRGGCSVRYDLTPTELDQLMGRKS